MTKFKAILAALLIGTLAVPVSGCATFARLSGQEQTATYDEKALITVELAYSFILTVVNGQAAAGQITPEQAERILPVLQRTDAAVRRARAVYDAGNAADAALATQDAVAQVAAVTQLLTELGVLRRAP
jgi:hypothetical protein